MRTAVLVLSWNGATMLADCLSALRGQRGAAADVLVVDNGSTDGSATVVRNGFPEARLIETGRNLGFAAGMNVGLQALGVGDSGAEIGDARETGEHVRQSPISNLQSPPPPDVVVLLNQDTVVARDWLAAILRPLSEDARVGAVGCKIYYPDGRTIQHAGKVVEPGRAMTHHLGYGERDVGQHDRPLDVEDLTGAALALRVSALAEVGMFDEGYSPAYYEDVDLCWRLRRAGYILRYEPRATLCHAESRSIRDVVRRSALMNRNRLRFVVKTWPADRLDAFQLVEQARLASLEHGLELRTLRRAYLEGALRAGEWIAARRGLYPVSPSDERRIRQLCFDLRRFTATMDRGRARR